MTQLTLGSLFSGIGGFEYAASLCGIKTLWNSEIEPFPCKVLAARFPDAKQLGDVRCIDGAKTAPVDIITFGSPCTNLSIAGNREGFHGKDSGLFYEAIRIIKEMRSEDKRNKDRATGRTDTHIRPRFAVWENVTGAFSSNKGYDFHKALEAIGSVCQEGLSIPRPEKWGHAGYMVGNGWSVAWRVYDAQYWGLPQRRKRIYLVADFAGERADEILFVGEGGEWYPPSRGEAKEVASSDTQGSAGRGDSVSEVTPPVVYDARGNGNGNVVSTLVGDHGNRVTDYTSIVVENDFAYCMGNGQLNQITMAEQVNCLDAMHDKQAIITNGKPPRKYTVRRLTPLEYARCQGFPDWWCEGLGGSDTAIYKAYGNSVAIPCVYDVISRIRQFTEKEQQEEVCQRS